MWKSNFCKDDKVRKVFEQSIPSGSKQESDSGDGKSSTNSDKHDMQEEQNQETVIN